jgi:hypothetical protein
MPGAVPSLAVTVLVGPAPVGVRRARAAGG